MPKNGYIWDVKQFHCSSVEAKNIRPRGPLTLFFTMNVCNSTFTYVFAVLTKQSQFESIGAKRNNSLAPKIVPSCRTLEQAAQDCSCTYSHTMDTDLFANLTALSPPPSTAHRLAAARSRATMTTTVSAIATTTTTASLQVDDNDDNNDNNDDDDDALGACESASSSGLQWSAEPSAFTGGVRSHVQQQSPLRMRLALDLSSSAHQQHAFRPERVSISQLSQNTSYSQQQFAELFYADSQEDDVDGIIDTTTTSGSSSATGAAGAATYVTRGSQRSGTRRSPPSTVRFTTESAGTPKTDEEAVRDDAGGARTLSQTPLGGRANQTSALSVSEDVALGAVSTTRDASVVALSNRLGHDKEEKDDGENHHRDDTGDADNDRGQDPRIDSSPSTTLARDEQETERFPDSASDDDSDAFPDTQALSDTETDEGGGEYDMENANTEPMTEDGTEPMETSMGGDGGTELEPADDDDDNDVPQTQPSSSPTQTSVARTLSPVQDSHGKVAPSPGRAALRRRDKTTSQPPLADSEHPNVALEGASSCRDDGDDVGAETVGAPTKVSSASRNLAFSFALPDSQENAPQGVETAPDVSSLGNPASNGAIRPSDTETAVGRTRPPRTRTSERGGGLPRPPIAATATSEVDHSSDAVSTGTSSVESTPTRRTRKRSAPSPDVGIADAPTPAKRATATPRRSQRATASTRTGAGTPGRHTAPSLRTRSIPTTPLAPPSRIVSAHSKNMFKSKYDFCVTGFASDTQAKVVKLIEDHGGRVGEKEILHPTYEKPVVVVATAIAWRKLKFRYAVACGIPVVHPEWLRACVKAGEVVPFAGYFVPSGYSIVHRKFECLPVRPLDVFAGLSFGIPYDVEHSSKTSTKDLGDLIAFLLRACGAKRVVEVRGQVVVWSERERERGTERSAGWRCSLHTRRV